MLRGVQNTVSGRFDQLSTSITIPQRGILNTQELRHAIRPPDTSDLTYARMIKYGMRQIV